MLETAIGPWLRDFETDNSTMMDLQRQFDQPVAALHNAVGEIKAVMERGEREQADALYHNRFLPAELRIFELIYEGIAYADVANEQRDRITAFAQSIALGDFNIDLDVQQKDEIGVLATPFGKCLKPLNTRPVSLTG